MPTFIERYLSFEEVNLLETEIQTVDYKLWTKHISKNYSQEAFKGTALLEGLTIHLNWPTTEPNLAMPVHQDKFPNIMKMINKTLGQKSLGRAYIHKLQPGNKIRLHHDRNLKKKMKIFKRYQIYFDIPLQSTLILDNKIIRDNQTFRNSLVDFDLTNFHAYQNNSDKDWFFVVFDQSE